MQQRNEIVAQVGGMAFTEAQQQRQEELRDRKPEEPLLDELIDLLPHGIEVGILISIAFFMCVSLVGVILTIRGYDTLGLVLGPIVVLVLPWSLVWFQLHTAIVERKRGETNGV